MTSSARLMLSAALIVMSSVYAVLVAKSPEVASAVAAGYIAVLLSVFTLINVWKKP